LTHCKYCGNAVDSDMTSCPSCGAQVDHQESKTFNVTIDLSEITHSLRQTNEGLKDIAEALVPDDESEPQDNAYAPKENWSNAEMPRIKNYLALSIISTVCCCFPFGIPAIIYGTLVNKRLKSGDVDGAKKASKRAKMWMLIAVIAGVLAWIFYTIGNQ